MNKRLRNIIVIPVFILLIPLIAMQFTDEVNWTLADFIVAGTLLIGTALLIDFASRKIDKKYRSIIIIGIIVLFLLLWVEMAVGIFGSPLAGS